MSLKRLGTLIACALGAVLVTGVLQATASGPKRVLEFGEIHINVTQIGFVANSTTIPPVGAKELFTGLLINHGSQFGKPKGAVVGRILLDCTVLTEAPDGICTGIAHVPDGFFTFAGNGAFTGLIVKQYAITGGVGAYANDRGELKTTAITIGRQLAQVTLSP